MGVFRRLGLSGGAFQYVLGSFLVVVLSSSLLCQASELMFELPDRDRQCFYEDIDKGVSSTLEYQVPIIIIKGHCCVSN
jgi:hypothetical protein